MHEIENEQQVKNFVAETELRTRLITDLTQLIKYCPGKTELHIAAIEILTGLIEQESSFRKSVGDTGTELGEEVLRQLGVNVAHSSLLHAMIRETTSLQVTHDTRTNVYRSQVPVENLEVLAASTAEDASFLTCLLNFLICVHKNSDREDLNNQEAGRFWGGVRTALMNMLQLPADGHCYIYQIPVTITATQLLFLLSVKQSVEQDVTNVDAIIARLDFELTALKAEESTMVYPVQQPASRPGSPRLDHRQELCHSLVKLISSSINRGMPRNSSIANIGPLDDDEQDDDFIRAHEMQIRMQQNVVEALGGRSSSGRRQQEMAQVLRERRRAAGELGMPGGQPEGDEPEEEKDEEAPHAESVAVSRRVLESKLMATLRNVFDALAGETKAKVSVAYEPVVYPALWLITSVARDIPTSIPELIRNEVITKALIYMSGNIVPGTDYFYIILSALNAFTLHEEGAEHVARHKVISRLFRTLIAPAYSRFLSSHEPGVRGMESLARELLTLYTQAKPNIKSDIVHDLRHCLSELKAQGVNTIRELGTMQKARTAEREAHKEESPTRTSERLKTMEQCKDYAKALRSVIDLMFSLVQNVSSREHAKFLSSLNESNEVLRNILTISEFEAILNGALDGRETVPKYDDSQSSHILKFYLGEIGRLDLGGGEAPESVVLDMIKTAVRNISTLFGLVPGKGGVELGDFVLGKRPLHPVSADDPIAFFPKDEMILIALNVVEWICKTVKLFGRTFPSGGDIALYFISEFHLLLIREVVRLRVQRTGKDPAKEAAVAKELLSQVSKCMEDSDDSMASERLNSLLFSDSHGPYEQRLYLVYNKVSHALADLARSTVRKVRRYEFDPRENRFDMLQPIGRCAAKFIKEASSNPAIQLSAVVLDGKEKVAECEARVLHNILLVRDMNRVLMNDVLSVIQLYEFYSQGGFEQLLNLYQNTVNLIISAKSTNSVIADELNILATYLVRTYTTIMSPQQLRMLSSKLIQPVERVKAEMVNQGFKTTEDFVASILAYTVESLLFQTRYGDYKTAVRFLAECVPLGFKIFLNVVRKYPNKETLTQLLQDSPSAGPETAYEEFIMRRMRRERAQQPVPPSMVEHMVLMGFSQTEAEDALRHNDLDVDKSVVDILTHRDEIDKAQQVIFSDPAAIVRPKSGIRKLEAKGIPKEMEGWLDYILASLYEALYSTSSYKCKYLMYTLSEFQSVSRPYKVRHAFALLLNELQTLLFSLELSYGFEPIQNQEFPVTELAEVNITEKLRKKIKKYTSAEGIREDQIIVLHKMAALVDVITTFLRLSKTNELLKMMCENKIAQCLIVVLSKLTTNELILPGRKLIPKVLVLLTMIYKEVNQTLQGAQLDQNMKSLLGESAGSPGTEKRYTGLLPAADDNRRLVQLLCELLDMDEPMTAKLRTMKSETKSKNSAVLLTSEVITAVVLLLCHMTKDYENSAIVAGSGVLQRLFGIRQVVSSLFAKAQWSPEKGKPASEKEVEDLRKASATDMDRFLGSMSFLVGRNAYAFLQSCQRVGVLQREMQREGKDKVVAKYMLTLNKESMMQLIEEGCARIPNVPVQTGKKDPLSKEETEYMALLGAGVRESAEIMKTSNVEVIVQLISRIIDLHFETKKGLEERLVSGEAKPMSRYIITETLLIEILGQVIRIYPETLGLLLTFKNKSKVTGNNIVSFLFSSLFPLQHVSLNLASGARLQPNDEWKAKTTQVVRFLTYENSRLHRLRHRVVFAEMRKRVVAEIFRVLSRDVNGKLGRKEDKTVDPFVLACAYSTFSILEGLLISADNSVQFPKTNQYTLLKEIVGQKQSLIQLCTHIMRKFSLHSGQTEPVVSSIVNVLERITRFNRLLMLMPAPSPVAAAASIEKKDSPMEELKFAPISSTEPIPALYDEDFAEDGPVPMEVSTGSEEEEEAKGGEDAEPPAPEEEVKVPAAEPEGSDGQVPPLHRESSYRNAVFQYDPNESMSDEEGADQRYSPPEYLRQRMGDVYDPVGEDGLRRRSRRSQSRPRDNRSVELDAVQVQINAEPQDKGKSRDVKSGLADIYEREAAGETNNQIMKVIKGDVLGEENYAPVEGRDRDFDRERLGQHMFEEVNAWRLREGEEEERRDELPAVSLFGYTLDKQKVGELLKNQLMSSMPIQEIVPEEKKEEKKVAAAVPVPEPEAASSLRIEEKKEEEKKAEVHKEEAKKEEKKEAKKEEKRADLPGISLAEFTNLLGSLMGNAPRPPNAPAAPVPVPPGASLPVPPPPVAPEAKSEEKKQEEHKGIVDLTHALIAQRRHELALLVPNVQVEDDNLLLQIDPEFLRALTPDMRTSAVQQLLAQNRPANAPASPGGNRGPADMDPATFIATIADENLRDEILMTATPEFLASLPPDMTARAENLRERNAFERVVRRGGRDDDRRGSDRKTSVNDPVESLLLIPDRGDSAETEIAKAVLRQTSKIGEDSLKSLIRLLYINAKSKIPLNALLTNLCISKPKLYKLLNSLLFILSKHFLYEKYYQSKSTSMNVSDYMSVTKLSDVDFPPICLYRGMEFSHLTYSVVSLRIFSLLSALLCKPTVSRYFFMPEAEVANEKLALKDITDLGRKIEKLDESANKVRTPLTELLSLTGSAAYRTSEKHLETVINFVTDLFNTSELIAKQRKEEKVSLPVISVENVHQLCNIFYFEVMSDAACSKLVEILAKLSGVEENALAILGEIDHILDLIGEAATREWRREIKQLDQSAKLAGLMKDLDKEEDKHQDTRIEVKLGRILRLLKRLYDINTPKGEDDSPSKILKLYVTEGDSIEEAIPMQKKADMAPQTDSEVRSIKIRKSVFAMLKKESLIGTFDVLTDLVAIISKKSSGGENNSRKSQLLLRLVPAIESLIMTYDYNFKDITETTELLGQIKQIREAKPEERETMGAKYRRAYVFYKFLERNHRAFNNLIRQMSQHTFQTVIKPFILRFPSLLDFENKRNYFKHEQKRIRGHEGMATLRVNVGRDSIFTDSYSQLANLPLSEVKNRVRVSFKGEQAADAGGVTREWYTMLSRAMFNPIVALFKKSAHGNTYQPDPKSVIEPNHLNYFKFIGRIIGKALLDGQYLECYFTRALYKTLVGQTLTIQDMQDYDAEMYKGLLWVRDNDATALDCYFTYTVDYFGQPMTKELVEGGKTLKVTNENKHLFIIKTCKAMLYDAIKPQIEALQKGLYEVIPKQLISIFDYREIELLISGLPDVDIIDLKKNTEYSGYSEKNKFIEWFWEVLESFSTKERAEFLQFVTGTSKVPLDGFKNLPGASGVQRFQIHKVYGDSERLPSAHTWYAIIETNLD